MPRLSLGLGAQNIRKVGRGAAPLPTSVLIENAGAVTSDGNYVWDGVSLVNGKRYYIAGSNAIFWNGAEWIIEDAVFEDNTYMSSDLITWFGINGASEPGPTGTLSYS